MRSVDQLIQLPVFIPPVPKPIKHHPISRGKRPYFYRPQDLKDIGLGKTLWGDSFEKILVGLYWTLGRPVPYAFITPDGMIRSLDAGCLKFLVNRFPPEITFHCDLEGYIDAVEPNPILLDRYASMKELLENRIKGARPASEK